MDRGEYPGHTAPCACVSKAVLTYPIAVSNQRLARSPIEPPRLLGFPRLPPAATMAIRKQVKEALKCDDRQV